MKYTYSYISEGSPARLEKVILMSKSPRRQELLKDLHPEIETAEIDEIAIQKKYMERYKDLDFIHRAGKTCCEIAKAKSGTGQDKSSLYISADTMVICENQIYNKPKDSRQAEEMLRSYFGKEHHVITGVCLRSESYLEVFYSLAKIKFVDYYPYLSEQIKSYIDSKNPMDKAGAYGIQEISPYWVEYIEGDINTIIGLPVSELARRIKDSL